MDIIKEYILNKESIFDNLDKDSFLWDMRDEILKSQHKIILDTHNMYRWEEINNPSDINSDIKRFMLSGIDKNDERYRDYYRNMGYSLYGYWEIFYCKLNNPIADEYDTNKGIIK